MKRPDLAERNRSVRAWRPYEDADWLRMRYHDRLMDLREIASEAGCGLRTVARWMETHAIPRRPNSYKRPGGAYMSGPKNKQWTGNALCECGARKTHSAAHCRACKCANQARHGIADVMTLVRQWTYTNWRDHVYARDLFTCQACGDRRGSNLCAHHKVPLSTLVRSLRDGLKPDLATAAGRHAFVRTLISHPSITSLDNGVTLCADCHKAAHQSITLTRRTWRDLRASV